MLEGSPRCGGMEAMEVTEEAAVLSPGMPEMERYCLGLSDQSCKVVTRSSGPLLALCAQVPDALVCYIQDTIKRASAGTVLYPPSPNSYAEALSLCVTALGVWK